MVQAESKVDEKDCKNSEEGEDCKEAGLLHAFSQTTRLSEYREEAVDVCVRFKDESASEGVDGGGELLKFGCLVGCVRQLAALLPLGISLELAHRWDQSLRYTSVTSVTSIAGFNHHPNCHVGLLEYVKILAIHDVAYTGDNVAMLLVDLEHLSRCLSSSVTKHGHLQRNLVHLFNVLPDALDPKGQDKMAVHVYQLGKLRWILT